MGGGRGGRNCKSIGRETENTNLKILRSNKRILVCITREEHEGRGEKRPEKGGRRRPDIKGKRKQKLPEEFNPVK